MSVHCKPRHKIEAFVKSNIINSIISGNNMSKAVLQNVLVFLYWASEWLSPEHSPNWMERKCTEMTEW